MERPARTPARGRLQSVPVAETRGRYSGRNKTEWHFGSASQRDVPVIPRSPSRFHDGHCDHSQLMRHPGAQLEMAWLRTTKIEPPSGLHRRRDVDSNAPGDHSFHPECDHQGAALFYSLIESAKLAGGEPRGYLREVTRRCFVYPVLIPS